MHARSLDVCIVGHEGAILLHRHMPAGPEPFLQAVTPSREGLVVAVACLFTWYGRAALCADEGMPLVLGHALSMQALHGGTATNDMSDAHKIAALLRGGLLPQASGSPAERRATRDRLRRRPPLRRTRAALLSPVQHTNSQDTRPAIGKTIASKAHRESGAARVEDRAVHKTLAVDLALLTSDDALLKDLERFLRKTATHHAPHPWSLLPTVPGVGTIVRRVLLDAIPAITRFPSVQDCASSCRLGKCRKASGGKR